LAWGAACDLSRADQAGQRAADEAAIRQATKDFVLAFNSGDSKAAAVFWTKEGDYIGDDGDAVRFGERVAGLTKQADGAHRPALSVSVETLRFVTDDVAIADGASDSKAAGAARPTHGRYCAVW